MSQHLPLVAAQPGIWMAEKLSDLPSAWSVAHYVELTGDVDAPLLARAVVVGLAQADTLRMRFTEDNGEVWQWVDDALIFELPEIIDLRTNIDPHGTAQALMLADLQQDLRVDSGKPLVFHQLIHVADNRWYWYQRYHHLLVDGFSFPAITRQIANIYCTWLRGEPTPASPFTPFADVVEEYQQYRESEAWQRDAAFWAEQRRQLPPPASLSPAPLPGRSASADILRLKLEFTDEALREVARLATERKTGARGLRSIMENIMMDLMYEVPSDNNIGICTITGDVVRKTGEPEIVYRDAAVPRQAAARRLKKERPGEIA